MIDLEAINKPLNTVKTVGTVGHAIRKQLLTVLTLVTVAIVLTSCGMLDLRVSKPLGTVEERLIDRMYVESILYPKGYSNKSHFLSNP